MPRIAEVFGEVTYYEVEEGSTINDFVLMRNPELKNFPVPVVAGKNKPGVDKVTNQDDVTLVLRKDWDQPLQKNDVIAIIAVPQPKGGGGGGSGNVMNIVLGTVMLVAGVLLAWNPGGWALMGLSTSFFVGLAITGGTLLLSGIVGMMNQPKLPSGALSNEEASPTYSLNGSTNQARLLQPVPEGFGKIMVTPDVVAQPYYTYENNDQYLYQVFGIGRGSYEIQYMMFGEQVFWRDGHVDTSSALVQNANEVSVQQVEPGGAVTLFPDNVESNPNVSQIRLFPADHEDYTGWMGPYVASPPGTSGTKIQIDFLFPRGVGRYNKKGDLKSLTIRLRIKYRQIDDFGVPSGETYQDSFVITENTLTAQRRSKFITIPSGRWQFWFVNATKGSSDDTEPYLDEVYVDGLRTYLQGTLRYSQSVVAVRIKATNLLSSNAQQQFRVVQTRKLPIWNPATKKWSSPTPTRRFDAAIAAMCKAQWGGRLTDDRVDLEALAYCQSKIDEFGWNFDAFIDSAYTVYDLITQSCLPFRVFPRLVMDKISFMFDEKDRPIRHVFTPRDIVRGSLVPSWATYSDDSPDDIIVSYLDEDVNYARREVQATLPNSESREPKYLQYPIGVCNRDLAHDYGVYVAACNRHRRLMLDFGVETMGRMLYVGDVVSVQHPRLRSAGFGKVVDWNAQQLKIYVDTMPTSDAAPIKNPNLWMVFTDPYGKPWGPVKLDSFAECIATLNRSDYNTVVKQQNDLFNWITAGYQSQPTVWALQTGKNINRRYIIKNISFQDLEHATLTVMNDDPQVYDYNIPTPPWEYRQNNAMWTNLTPPTGFRATYMVQQGIVRCTWNPSVGANTYELWFGTRVSNMNKRSGIRNNSVDLSIDDFVLDATHIFQIRSADQSSVSKWYSTSIFIGVTSA